MNSYLATLSDCDYLFNIDSARFQVNHFSLNYYTIRYIVIYIVRGRLGLRFLLQGGIGLIVSFGNKVARDIWGKDASKSLPRHLWLRAKALMTIMHYTSTLDDLKIKGQPPNIRLYKLKGDRKGTWSVTIELPWCITFKYKDAEFSNVCIENYHKG